MGVNAEMFGLVPAEHTSPLYLRKQNIDIVDAFPQLFEDGDEPIQLPSENGPDIGDHDLLFPYLGRAG